MILLESPGSKRLGIYGGDLEMVQRDYVGIHTKSPGHSK